MWRNFTERGNASLHHMPAKSWSSPAPMASSSSTWTRQQKSTHHGNSSCTITGVYAKFPHLPHSPHAWNRRTGRCPGAFWGPWAPAPAATAPQSLTVFINLSSPHLCWLRGRHSQQHSDTQASGPGSSRVLRLCYTAAGAEVSLHLGFSPV